MPIFVSATVRRRQSLRLGAKTSSPLLAFLDSHAAELDGTLGAKRG